MKHITNIVGCFIILCHFLRKNYERPMSQSINFIDKSVLKSIVLYNTK